MPFLLERSMQADRRGVGGWVRGSDSDICVQIHDLQRKTHKTLPWSLLVGVSTHGTYSGAFTTLSC